MVLSSRRPWILGTFDWRWLVCYELACRFWTQLQSNLETHRRLFTQEHTEAKFTDQRAAEAVEVAPWPSRNRHLELLVCFCGAKTGGNRNPCSWKVFAAWGISYHGTLGG